MQAYGTLYVVATPIGNMEDLSPRAARTLSEVDCIAAEDTRAAALLLDRAGVANARVLSYHEHNEERRARELVGFMLAGETVALISEAGTPGISDPGFRLIRKARESEIPVLAIPGPSAAVAALSVSGMPTDRFAFLGFPPRGPALKEWLEEYLSLEMTLVLYEAPRRVLATLDVLSALASHRMLSVSRELTKIYEDTRHGTPTQLIAHYRTHAEQLRGEFTVVIAPSNYHLEGIRDPLEVVGRIESSVGDQDDLHLREVELLVSGGYRPSEAVAAVARGHRLTRSELYRAYQAWKNRE